MDILEEKKTCPPKRDLEQLLQGNLSQWTSLGLRQHVESCVYCQRALAKLRLRTSPDDSINLSGELTNTESNSVTRNTDSMPKLELETDHLFLGTKGQATTAYNSDGSSIPDFKISPEGTKVSLSFLSSPQGPDELGRLGSYKIIKLLGAGGMGLVFEAEDTLLRRQVALKVMKPEIAIKEDHRKRFLQEARSGAAIPHDNIATVFQVGIENNVPYLAMQFLQGESLGSKLHRDGKIPVDESLRIIREVALGIAAAHETNLIHRDIKPDNIWLESDGQGRPWKRVKILDFGLATAISGTEEDSNESGMIMGTPHYMAPEQARGLPLDSRCDLFSMGCVLYQMISGELAFKGDNALKIMNALALHEPKPLNLIDKTVPTKVAELVHNLMIKKASERIASANDLIKIIDDIDKVDTQSVNLNGSGLFALPTPNLPGQGYQATLTPWYLNWKTGLFALAVIINLGLLAFNFSSFDTNSNGMGGLKFGDPLKVGVLHSTTGYMRTTGKNVKDLTMMAIAEINESGGVLEYSDKGVPISRRRIIAFESDGQSNPATFATQAEKLITQEKVKAIFGCWNSTDRKECLSVFNQHNNILFYPTSYEGLEQNPNVVYLGAAPNQQLEFTFNHMINNPDKKKQFKKLFHVGVNSVYSKVASEILSQQLKEIKEEDKDIKAVLAGEKLLNQGNFKFDEVIKAIVTAKPDLIINTLTGDANRDFFRALRAQGIKGSTIPTLSFHISAEILQELDIESCTGDFVGWNYLPSIESEQNKAFLEKVKAKLGNDTIVNDSMEAGYYGVYLWAQAVREAKSFEPDKVLQAIKGRTYAAPGGSVEIDKDTLHTYMVPRFGKIIGPGKFEIIQGNEGKPLRPIPYPRYRSPESWAKYLDSLHTTWGNNWFGTN
ncbi:MAG: bifunctional serine/threonine-protein kinase/ABC transporter substrate-binding protein [Planctomycetota bacterium]